MSTAKRPRHSTTKASSQDATRQVARAKGIAKGASVTQHQSGASITTVRIPRIVMIGVGMLLLLGLAAFLLGTRQSETVRSNNASQLVPVSTLQAADFHSLAVSPQDSDRVWFGSHDGIQESADGGKTWHSLPGGPRGDAMSMSLPPTDPLRVYITGHNIFKRSSDGGKTWQDVQTDLPGTDIHGFASDPANAQHVYALIAGGGLFQSTDGGSRWQSVAAQPPGASGAFAVVPGNPSTLYAATSLGAMRSQDGAQSWHPASTGLPQSQNSLFALLPVPGKLQELYAGTSNGLYHSTDTGTTWQQAGINGQQIVALAASQSGPLRVYALTGKGALFRLEGTALSSSK